MSPKLNRKNDRNKKKPSGHREPLASRKHKFLRACYSGATVREAARIAGVATSTPYCWRDTDPEFAQVWKHSREDLVEDLELEAFQQAIGGDRRLLMFLLKSYKPETYNQRQHRPVSSDSTPFAEFLAVVRERRAQQHLKQEPKQEELPSRPAPYLPPALSGPSFPETQAPC